MVKVVNISEKTVEIAGVLIKPHKVHIFKELSLRDRQKLSAMSAVGLIRAYEGNYNKPEIKEEPVVEENTIKEETKPTRKSSKKK